MSKDGLQTTLVGESCLVVVNNHLRYRQDEVQFPGGTRGTYTYIDDRYAAAAAVPLDRRNGRRSVFLIRQERYPSQTIGWEVPAGGPKVDEASGTPLETQLEVAQRELREEGGLVAQHWHQLPQQVENVGRGNSRSDVFAAAGFTVVQSEIEVCEVITDAGWFDMGQVEAMMLNGEISAGHTMAAIAVANAFVNRNPDHPIAQIAGQA